MAWNSLANFRNTAFTEAVRSWCWSWKALKSEMENVAIFEACHRTPSRKLQKSRLRVMGMDGAAGSCLTGHPINEKNGIRSLS